VAPPLPEPFPGLVIHYEYLWRHEHLRGLEDGAKRRPCAVVLVVSDRDGRRQVLVAPITHRRPEPPAEGILIPPRVKAQLGLDAEPSWVIVTDLNAFEWPGADLYRVPGGGGLAYGELPQSLLAAIVEAIREARRRGASPMTTRPGPQTGR